MKRVVGRPPATPLRASLDQLAGVPPALAITGEADVAPRRSEAYAAKVRQAGVLLTAARYQGIVHDFAMLNALRDINAAQAAITEATAYLTRALAPCHDRGRNAAATEVAERLDAELLGLPRR